MNDITLKALNNPKAGDHWTEMFSWDLFVVGRSGNLVLTLEGARPCLYPDEAIAKTRTLSDFVSFLSYKKNSYSSHSGTWARCIERGKKVSGWKEARFKITWEEK